MRPKIAGRRLALIALLASIYVAACAWPYGSWWADPILFDDDLIRVGGMRRSDLSASLFRPFNEHMAPLFEVVSWLAWRAAGRDIPAVASTFRAASFLAWGATGAGLALVIRRETGSTAASLLALALFCLSSVSAETVLWFSASSFEWAAAASLYAWYAASASGSPSSRTRWTWLAGSALASLAAPAFSAIGILAGPLASLRAAMVPGVGRWSRFARAALPGLGTMAYLLMGECFRYREVVGASVGRNLDPSSALWATIRAPSLVLIPGLFGSASIAGKLPGGWAAASTVLVAAVAAFAAVRGRNRPLLLGGLAWIAGGYFATYATRAKAGDLFIFAIERYHLFPMIGLIWLIVAALEIPIRRLDRRPVARMAAASTLALVMLGAHAREMGRAVRPFRDADQPRALVAAGHLESNWRHEGYTLAQAMTAIDPIRPRWFLRPLPFHPVLYLFPTGPDRPNRPDDQVRPGLIAGLSIEDREAIFGGMEATRHAVNHAESGDREGLKPDHVTVEDGMTAGRDGGFEASGPSSAVEYSIESRPGTSRFLAWKVSRPVELWWADDREAWSPGRSVRWRPDPDRPEAERVVPLSALPHFRPGQVRRLRLVAGRPGPIRASPPRFLP